MKSRIMIDSVDIVSFLTLNIPRRSSEDPRE